MTLTLYGASRSTCTARVAIVLHEKQIPFVFVEVNLARGEHKSPEYLEKQPFGEIPYIDDDGFTLYESRAICRYICAKYPNQGTNLVPTDLKAHALYEQAVSAEGSNFDPAAAAAVFEMLFKPLKRLGAPDKAVFEKHISTLSAKLNGYEAILSKQKYLAGDEVTLADLFHLPCGVMLAVAGSDVLSTKPNVFRWFNDLTSRPSWQAVKDGVRSTV